MIQHKDLYVEEKKCPVHKVNTVTVGVYKSRAAPNGESAKEALKRLLSQEMYESVVEDLSELEYMVDKGAKHQKILDKIAALRGKYEVTYKPA